MGIPRKVRVPKILRKKWIAVVGAGVATIALIPFVHSMMLNQSLTYTTIKTSNDSLAVNYIVALYLYGVWADRLSKRVGKRRAWLIWGVGLIVIFAVLRFVFGWELRW